MMNRQLHATLTTSCLLAARLALVAAAFDAPGNFNPIVPGYFADPTIEQFGDTFYLYATTDWQRGWARSGHGLALKGFRELGARVGIGV